MRLIKSEKANKEGVEMISIHIPKTGGRSFHYFLKQVFGDSIDNRYEKQHFFPNGNKYNKLSNKIPTGVNCIHGHLTISQVQHIINIDHPKVITWVRNPIDRVISNYYYFMKRIRDGDTPEKQHRKINFNLIEYASQIKRRNRMTEILKGMEIKDFFFIGIMEQFEQDIRILCNLMDWHQQIDVPHINNSTSFKLNNECATQYNDIDEAMRLEVAKLNEKDMILYAEIKKLRGIK